MLEGNTLTLFGVFAGEEFKKQLYFLIFGCFKYSHFIISFLPIPLINSPSEMYLDESASNYLKSLSPILRFCERREGNYQCLGLSIWFCVRDHHRLGVGVETIFHELGKQMHTQRLVLLYLAFLILMSIRTCGTVPHFL